MDNTDGQFDSHFNSLLFYLNSILKYFSCSFLHTDKYKTLFRIDMIFQGASYLSYKKMSHGLMSWLSG